MTRGHLGILLLLGATLAAPAMERRVPPPGEGDWELVWQDEFDRPGAPDSTRWDYELGFERNEEPQLYTRSLKNARVERGLLVLEAHRETLPNPAWQAGSEDWRKARREAACSSASLKARDLKAWRYGRFEIRARLPQGPYAWPAFWLVGPNGPWPACGEIDILEAYDSEAGHNRGSVLFEVAGKHAFQTETVAVPDAFTHFHTYAMDWDAQRIQFLLDGVVFESFELDKAGPGPDNPFRQPLTLLLSLALRGRGAPLPEDALPARFVVDYVRIWQRRS